MTEAATIQVDEKFFAEVCEQQRRVETARSVYKDAKNEAKEAKDALDQALETIPSDDHEVDYDQDDDCCPTCHGDGGWHDCGEDTCCCLDGDELTDICPDCGGEG